MKVILCSKSVPVKERWSKIIAETAHKVTHASSVFTLVSLIRQENADLVIMHNPCVSPDSAVELINLFPSCKFLLLSDRHDDEEGVAYLRAGVSGYASTYIKPERLNRAIKIIFEGGVWVGQQLMQHMIAGRIASSNGIKNEQIHEIGGLTERELDVARLISKGVSNKEIARKLDITERTVKSHLNTIYRKTNTTGRLQLALLMRD